MQTETLGEDLLVIEDTFIRASGGKRFLNYIIDIFIFYVIIFGGLLFFFYLSPESTGIFENDSFAASMLDRLLGLCLYAILIGAMEYFFKGKSIGKMITGTRAVNFDGSTISGKTAILRGFSRAVPFVVFSALGTPCEPWQDRWTDTMVIDERQMSKN